MEAAGQYLIPGLWDMHVHSVADGELRGPSRFLTAGPAVDGDPPLNSKKVVVRTAAEARAAVEQLASNGADPRPIVPLELENARLLKEAGIVLLAATDVGVPLQVPGLSLHVELERLAEAGLSPLEVLQTATLNPARVLQMTDSLGTVEPGKLADLVLVDANPLEDIRNTQKIRAVIANGRLYRRAGLDQLLAASTR
jgi:imidazolonepropionase-like amidohydrolase